MRDIARIPHSIKHEVTHLLRDAQTGHISRFMEKMKKDPIVHERYQSQGHDELEFEIDAQIASLESLRKSIGDQRYDKLTPERIHEIMPGIHMPIGGTFLSIWVKRLMREGLLTTGMREAWNL